MRDKLGFGLLCFGSTLFVLVFISGSALMIVNGKSDDLLFFWFVTGLVSLIGGAVVKFGDWE